MAGAEIVKIMTLAKSINSAKSFESTESESESESEFTSLFVRIFSNIYKILYQPLPTTTVQWGTCFYVVISPNYSVKLAIAFSGKPFTIQKLSYATQRKGVENRCKNRHFWSLKQQLYWPYLCSQQGCGLAKFFRESESNFKFVSPSPCHLSRVYRDFVFLSGTTFRKIFHKIELDMFSG